MMMMCRRRRQPAAAAPRSSSHTGLACCPFCFGRKCNTQQSPRENTRECWVVRVVLRAAVSRSVYLECPRCSARCPAIFLCKDKADGQRNNILAEVDEHLSLR